MHKASRKKDFCDIIIQTDRLKSSPGNLAFAGQWLGASYEKTI